MSISREGEDSQGGRDGGREGGRGYNFGKGREEEGRRKERAVCDGKQKGGKGIQNGCEMCVKERRQKVKNVKLPSKS